MALEFSADDARLMSAGDDGTIILFDTNTGQPIGFANLPIDGVSGIHRTVTTAGGTCPAAPPDNTNTPQTHNFGAVYNGGSEGPVDFAISPDTPAKTTPDDTSYSAPTGGVLATITLQVVGNECNTGPMVFDLDDGSPNPPGSKVVAFNGTGTTDLFLAESALGDGTHTETGGTCGTPTPTPTPCFPNCTPSPTPTATTSPSPTPPGTANVSLAKTPDNGFALYSDPVQYTITLTNNGPDVARQFSVFDDLPHTGWFENPDLPECTITSGSWVLNCFFDSLAVGASITINVRTNDARPCQTVDLYNVATVSNGNVP